MFNPVVKWSGSKRSQVLEILKYFPNNIDTYYEPFCGGCSMLRGLLDSNISVNHYLCSDLNSDLIALWNKIKTDPEEVIDWYTNLWNILNKDDDLERKKEFFNQIRDRLNKEHNPLDFMFIMRTTTNGMPRYNQNGDFNNSFHITRNGINPKTLQNIINDWSNLLNVNNVDFICTPYQNIKADKNDFLYLDPPYANTKGMYFGNFNVDEFLLWLSSQTCHYALSFDGISDKDNTVNIPNSLYDKHIYIESGNSSFKRLFGGNKRCIVNESLYVK